MTRQMLAAAATVLQVERLFSLTRLTVRSVVKPSRPADCTLRGMCGNCSLLVFCDRLACLLQMSKNCSQHTVAVRKSLKDQ